MFFIRNEDNNATARNIDKAAVKNKDKFLVSKQE